MFSVAESVLREEIPSSDVMLISGKLAVGYVDVGNGEMRIAALQDGDWVPIESCKTRTQVASVLLIPKLLSKLAEIVSMKPKGGSGNGQSRGEREGLH